MFGFAVSALHAVSAPLARPQAGGGACLPVFRMVVCVQRW